MKEELKGSLESGLQQDAVGAELKRSERSERSESSAPTAVRPAEGGPRPVPVEPGRDADELPPQLPSPLADPGADEDDVHLIPDPGPNVASDEGDLPPLSIPRLSPPRRQRALRKKETPPAVSMSPEQRLLVLDAWLRSGLPAGDFAPLVGLSKHTLYSWKKRFEEHGPAGLMDQQRGAKKGSRLPELTKRSILMLKESHPEWGCQRISDMLFRGPALPASPAAVARVLHEAGYTREEVPTQRHPDKVRRFERARPNQLWQTDLFTFMLKRQNRRVYLVAFLDDHSRFITGYGLHASQSAALVIEVLRAGLTSHGVPEEILTDNGSQYVTWRGKSQFTRELEKRGIRQVVAKPRHPQTLGKIERFWGTLWRECVEAAIFLDLEDARRRIGLFIDWYNFSRVHSGIDGLVPADRFFHAAPEILQTLKVRVAENSLELARHGLPKEPFYLTGQLDGQPFSVHQEGDRVILRRAGEQRTEIDLVSPAAAAAESESSSAASLPQPVCPQGIPESPWQPPDITLPLGVSPLDENFRPPSGQEESVAEADHVGEPTAEEIRPPDAAPSEQDESQPTGEGGVS